MNKCSPYRRITVGAAWTENQSQTEIQIMLVNCAMSLYRSPLSMCLMDLMFIEVLILKCQITTVIIK